MSSFSVFSLELQMGRDYNNRRDARFENEILDVCNSALNAHNFPEARVWGPCNQNLGYCGQPFDHVSSSQSVCILWKQGNDSTHPGIPFFKPGSHLLKGEGIVGKALMTNHPVSSTCIASSSDTEDRLPAAAVAIPLKSNLDDKSCILECFLPSVCTDPEEREKILTALFSTLKERCKNLCVVSDEAIDENSVFPSPTIRAPQPSDAVEQTVDDEPMFPMQFFLESASVASEPSVTSNLLLPNENPREAHPNHVMQLFPEPPRIESAEMRDAIGLGRRAASETREARHATGESTGGTSTGGAGSKRHWAWKYCSSIPGNSNGVICSFCGKKIKGGGITRFESHISGCDRNNNVKKCRKVPSEVKAETEQEGKKKRDEQEYS